MWLMLMMLGGRAQRGGREADADDAGQAWGHMGCG